MLSLFNNWGRSKKTSNRDIIEEDKASIRKGIYEVLRTGMAALTHLLILRKSSIWPRRAEDILTVVVVDFGPWVLPLSLNCSLVPFPSALPIICSASGGVIPAKNLIHGCQGRPERTVQYIRIKSQLLDTYSLFMIYEIHIA